MCEEMLFLYMNWMLFGIIVLKFVSLLGSRIHCEREFVVACVNSIMLKDQSYSISCEFLVNLNFVLFRDFRVCFVHLL